MLFYSPQITSAVWSWGDGTSTNGLSPTRTYSAAGYYNICVKAYASCGDSAYVCQNDSLYRLANHNNTNSSMIQVTVLNVNGVIGIKTNTNETAQVSVYPNPSKDNFIIETNSAEKYVLNMYDMNGKLVLSQTLQSKTNIYSSVLPTGIYNISIIENNHIINKRVVIAH